MCLTPAGILTCPLLLRGLDPVVSILLVAEPREHLAVSVACSHVVQVTTVLLRHGRSGADFGRSPQTWTWMFPSWVFPGGTALPVTPCSECLGGAVD